MNPQLQYYLQKTFGLPDKVDSRPHAEIFLAAQINEFIKNDFNQLVQILYHIDVNETKLKQVLNNNPNENAGKIIAALIIERQLQKIKSREEFSKKNNPLSDEEKW